MNKKILISSIITVVIIVMVSFTGVVGYQTTKSSMIARASPLFKVRTNRAIDEECKDINCNYVSKGNTLPFPKRDDKAIMFRNVVDSIRKMDDKTFDRFITYIIDSAQKDKKYNGVKSERIGEALYQVRNSDEPIPLLDAGRENKYLTIPGATACPTCRCITVDYGVKGFIACILLLPLAVLAFIYLILAGVIPTLFICPTMILLC